MPRVASGSSSLALGLVLPVGAFVVGSLAASSADEPVRREPIIVDALAQRHPTPSPTSTPDPVHRTVALRVAPDDDATTPTTMTTTSKAVSGWARSTTTATTGAAGAAAVMTTGRRRWER